MESPTGAFTASSRDNYSLTLFVVEYSSVEDHVPTTVIGVLVTDNGDRCATDEPESTLPDHPGRYTTELFLKGEHAWLIFYNIRAKVRLRGDLLELTSLRGAQATRIRLWPLLQARYTSVPRSISSIAARISSS
jgi:hypothetical protein